MTPWLHGAESLKGSVPQLVKKLSIFYGSRRFVAVFTTASHFSVSWVRSIRPPPHPKPIFFKVSVQAILPPTHRPSKISLSLRFLHQNPISTSYLPHTRHVLHPSHSWFHQPDNVWRGLQSMNLHTVQLPPSHRHPTLEHPQLVAPWQPPVQRVRY